MRNEKSSTSAPSSSPIFASYSTDDDEVVILDARAVHSDEEDGDDFLFVSATTVAIRGSGERSWTADAIRLRRKRAQLKAAKAAKAAQRASTLVEAVPAVGPEAATMADGAVEEADADASDVMGEDVSIAPTEQMDAPDDSEGAAPLALALAQTEGLTLQPSDSATGDRGQPLQLEAKRAAPSDDFGVDEWKLPAKKRRHALSPSTSLSPSPAYTRAPGAQTQMQPPADAKVELSGPWEEAEPVEETEPIEEIELHAPLTSEAAVLQATAEGLTLEPSTNASGYKGVFVDGARLQGQRRGGQAKIFNVRVKRAGTEVHLGFFATAEEGALVYARAQAQAEATNAKRMTLTAEEAVAQAAAEGLTLQKKADGAGYKCVKWRRDSASKQYEARVYRGGKQIHLGSFDTAEEAALAYARTAEAQAEVAKAKIISGAPTTDSKLPSKPASLTVDEVVAQATAEGLWLEPSNTSSTGYKGVTINNGTHHQSGRRFEVRVRRAGKKVFLGSYATAEEAALVYARASKHL